MRARSSYPDAIRRAAGCLPLVVLLLFPLGCDSSEPETVEAVITRLDFRLQQDDPEEVVRASVQDGAGLAPGAAVVADTLRFLPGAIYEGSVRLFGADGQNLTGQVTQNPENHQFFYETDAEVAFTGTDADVNNQPIGFTFEVSVLAMPVETSLRITLEHYGRFGFKGSTPDPEFDLDFSVLLSVS